MKLRFQVTAKDNTTGSSWLVRTCATREAAIKAARPLEKQGWIVTIANLAPASNETALVYRSGVSKPVW